MLLEVAVHIYKISLVIYLFIDWLKVDVIAVVLDVMVLKCADHIFADIHSILRLCQSIRELALCSIL